MDIYLKSIVPSQVQEGDILLRVDDGMGRAILIGQYIKPGHFPKSIVVFNPVSKALEMITDLPDELLVMKSFDGNFQTESEARSKNHAQS